VRVRVGGAGAPVRVDGQTVEHVRESWLLEDRWWTPQPMRRRYWELVTDTGRNTIIFRDLLSGIWYRQR
jgi:CO dehydrogenase/acetyl-CoA synthase delta subunit